MAAGGSPVCPPCQLAWVDRRVGLALRPLLRSGSALCVGVSGSPASLLLLQLLLARRLPPGSARKQRRAHSFSLHVVHVDEASGLPLPAGARCDPREVESAVRLLLARAGAAASGVEVALAPLAAGDMAALPDATARADLAARLRQRALLEFAASRSARLLLADTSGGLAAAALAAVAKGRGGALAAAQREARGGGGLIYPLREVSAKDAALAARHLHLPSAARLPAHLAPLGAGGKEEDTVDAAAARFVERLQAGTPRAVAAILGAVAKMEPRGV